MGISTYVTSNLANHQRTGCNNRIAWSLKGSIAYVSNSSVVNITHLTCMDGENWDFCEPYKFYPTDANNNAIPITHLSWSPLSTDLACADEHGNLSIYNQPTSELGAMTCVFQSSNATNLPQPHEMNKIIGFKWFESDNQVTIMNPVNLQNSVQGYITGTDTSGANQIAQYSVYSTHQFGPHIPSLKNMQKQACIAITRRGNLRLFSQGVSGTRYFEISYHVDRDGIAQESVLFSHASFAGCKDNTLLLTAYSSETETVYIYKLLIEWPALSAAAGIPNKKGGANHISTLKVQRLVRRKLMCSLGSGFSVSNIHLLPAGHKTTRMEPDPELQVAFSSRTHTVIQKFQISTRQTSLHTNFSSLSMRPDSSADMVEETTTSIIPKDTIAYKSLATNIGSINFDAYFYVCFIDGSIDIQFRSQYSTVNISNSSMQTLLTAGFQFPPVDTSSEMCLSHNMCSALYLDGQGKLRISYVKNTLFPPAPIPQPKPDFIVQIRLVMTFCAVTLAARHSMSTTHFCGNDLYAVMKQIHNQVKIISPESADQFLHILIRESYRAISFPLDTLLADRNTKGFSSLSLGRVLILKVSLGTSMNWKRDHMARIAWCEISLRTLVFAFSYTFKELASVQKRQQTPTPSEFEDQAKYIDSVFSMIRFLVDLIVFICQELYMASLEQNPYAYFASRKSVAMPLLLGKLSRVLLLLSFKVVKSCGDFVADNVEKSAKTSAEPVCQRLIRQLREMTQACTPISFEMFQQLLNEVERSMEEVYANSRNRHQLEEDLVVSAHVPVEVSHVVNRTVKLFTNILDNHINVPWLFYYNVSWLGLNEDEESEPNECTFYIGDKKAKLSLDNEPMTADASSKGNTNNNDNTLTNTSSGSSGSNNNETNNNNNNNTRNVNGNVSDNAIQKKPVPVHPHPAALRRGQEVDYVLKKHMATVPKTGIRCRCVRCGEISVWHPAKPSIKASWEMIFQKFCPCGGAWIPADY